MKGNFLGGGRDISMVTNNGFCEFFCGVAVSYLGIFEYLYWLLRYD